MKHKDPRLLQEAGDLGVYGHLSSHPLTQAILAQLATDGERM